MNYIKTQDRHYKRQFLNRFLFLIFLLPFLFLCGCATVKRPIIDIPSTAPKPAPIKKDIRVALVLGAGGSRGIAHVGVLEELEKAGIPIDLIVGSSAGSLIGALYGDNPNAKAIKAKVINLKRTDLLDPSIRGLIQTPVRLTGPIQGNALETFLVNELQAKTFDELKIPLIAVATNVDNNHITMLRSGPIAPAVHASSALPPFFAPVSLYNQTLIDGGVISPVPVQVARLFHPKVIIAVDISTPPSRAPLSNTFELLYRALHISFYELSRMQSTRAEITLHPDLVGYGTFDDQYNNRVYEKGRQSVIDAMQAIRAELQRKGVKLRPRREVFTQGRN
jgi:NTE family protein